MSAVPVVVSRRVDERDRFACVRCGAPLSSTSGSRHHRMRRAVGGHEVSNLILLCGSGTTGCHGFVHAHPASSTQLGFVVSANQTQYRPVDVPVFIWWPGARSFTPYVWASLDDVGGRAALSDREADARMAALGIGVKF